MLSMNLWSKASEFGSKLKDSLQLSNSDKPLVEKDIYDKLKDEYDKLKKDYDENSKKFENMNKEIKHKKENEGNITENEYNEYLNQMSNKFKNYILNLFGDDSNIKDEVECIFENLHDEKFDSKISEYNKYKMESILINNLINNNKDIIEDLISYKYLIKNEQNKECLKEGEKKENDIKEESLKNEGKNINESNNINLKEIKTNEDMKKIFLKVKSIKDIMEAKIDELHKKLTNNIQRFQLFQENIEKFQKDYKEIKNEENLLKGIINQKEKDLSEKENKIIELNNLIDKKNNELKEKEININGFKVNIDQLNLKIKEQQEIINEFNFIKKKSDEEIQNLNSKIKSYKDDMDLLQVNSDEINNKNIQITELMKSIESLKSSYILLEESKLEFAKGKNEEIEIYKNQILELTQQLNEINEKIQNSKKNEEIETIYIQKLNELENQNINYEKKYLNIKKENEEIKKELNEIKTKMIKELQDNEFMIDKRIISSVLVSYFDVNATELTKKNLLETLSSIMEYSNEDRGKMGLKPIYIGNNNKNDGKLKSISDGLYNFILNS